DPRRTDDFVPYPVPQHFQHGWNVGSRFRATGTSPERSCLGGDHHVVHHIVSRQRPVGHLGDPVGRDGPGQLPVAPVLRDLNLEGEAVATRQEVSRLPAILHAGREEVVFPDRDIQFLFPVLVVITKDHHVIAVLKLAPALKCGLDVLPLEVGLGTDISAQREYEQRGDDCTMSSGVTLQAHTYYSPCAAASSLPVGSGSSGATNGARHSGQPIWWSFGPRFNCSLRSA